MSDCKPKDMPKGPWRAIKVALDESLLLRFISGESVIVEHFAFPQDASVINCRQNGTDTELFVQSETYDLCTCLCTMPLKRINYSTGG